MREFVRNFQYTIIYTRKLNSTKMKSSIEKILRLWWWGERREMEFRRMKSDKGSFVFDEICVDSSEWQFLALNKETFSSLRREMKFCDNKLSIPKLLALGCYRKQTSVKLKLESWTVAEGNSEISRSFRTISDIVHMPLVMRLTHEKFFFVRLQQLEKVFFFSLQWNHPWCRSSI